MIKIGASGEKSSFSEKAAQNYARKENISEYEIIYLISIDNALTKLNKSKIDNYCGKNKLSS